MENASQVIPVLFCVVGLPILLFVILIGTSIRIVPEYQRLSIFRLGRYLGDKGPGVVLVIPLIDRSVKKELGEMSMISGQKLVGALGETRTTVYTNGKVLLANSEEWDAVSQTPISAGQRVRVVRMVLEVEKEETSP